MQHVSAAPQLPSSVLHGAPRTSGHGTIHVARVAGVSTVLGARSESPLRLVVARARGPAAWIFTSSYGGGLVDGDHVSLDVNVGESAALLLTTQASTKVYRGAERARGSRSDLRARVERDGLLVSWPDPVACFSDARYAQRTDVDLAPSASLVAVEVVTAGRIAHGEYWSFAHYRSDLRVSVAGAPRVLDALALDPAHGPLAARMGRFQAFGTVLLLGPATAALRASARSVADARLARRAEVVEAASPIGDATEDASAGLLLRIAASSVEGVTQRIHQRLAGVADLLGDDPRARKW